MQQQLPGGKRQRCTAPHPSWHGLGVLEPKPISTPNLWDQGHARVATLPAAERGNEADPSNGFTEKEPPLRSKALPAVISRPPRSIATEWGSRCAPLA